MNFQVFKSESELAAAAADLVVTRAEGAERLVVALSGGSTPEVLYQLLGGGEYRSRLAARNVVWVMGDERCVPPDDAASNQRMVRASLFREGVPPAHRFLPFRTELGDPAAIAEAFSHDWEAEAIEAIDLAFLGVGEDGHTASLFPGTEVLDVTEGIATSVWVAKLDMWRVTLTLPVLQAARSKVVLAAGAEKQDIVRRISSGESFPIVLAGATGDNAWWMIDEAAYPEELRMGSPV